MSKKSSTAPKIKTDQFTEFVAAVIRQLPRNLDSKLMQKCIEKQDLLANILHNAFNNTFKEDKEKFCKECGSSLIKTLVPEGFDSKTGGRTW